jgi:hypothetical protein
LLGTLLFGSALFLARILSRWAAGLLAFSGPLALIMVALLPHQLERLAAMPMGIALAGLGDQPRHSRMGYPQAAGPFSPQGISRCFQFVMSSAAT